MAKRPTPKKDIDITAAGYTPLRLLMGAVIKRGERKRFEKEDAEYQKSLKEMGLFEDGGGRANVPVSTNKNFMDSTKNVRKKSVGGKMKSADGIAVKGKTRLSMKGYGKNG